MALCISQRHSLRTVRSTRSNEPTKERHPKNKRTHQRNTSWMRCHQMPSSVSIAKSGLSYRIRRHCVERSFLFWLPRSTPSTSVQSILDFRPPQTVCHDCSQVFCLRLHWLGTDSSEEQLPTASTCFAKLKLPAYKRKCWSKQAEIVTRKLEQPSCCHRLLGHNQHHHTTTCHSRP